MCTRWRNQNVCNIGVETVSITSSVLLFCWVHENTLSSDEEDFEIHTYATDKVQKTSRYTLLFGEQRFRISHNEQPSHSFSPYYPGLSSASPKILTPSGPAALLVVPPPPQPPIH